MKILILTNHSYMLYRFRRALISALSESHEVVLCMPFVGHEEDFQAMGLRCLPLDMDRRGTSLPREWALLRALRRVLRQERPELVITYSIKPNIYAGLLCRVMGIPYCANVQGLGTAFQRRGLSRLVSVLYRLALAGAKTVFFENENNARTFCDKRILPESKITLLPGAGVDLTEFSPAEYPRREGFRFLYLGRIMTEKGMDELLTATERLYRQSGGRIRLELVGFYDDPYAQRVEALCREGAVVFHGFQQDPRPYYADCDCVVLPSYHEGMSNVLLEAAAMARPLIASDIPGCREAVEPGVTGLLCRCRDSEDLYRQMEAMAALPRERREAMGMAGRAKMEAQFDKARVVRQTVAALGLTNAGERV